MLDTWKNNRTFAFLLLMGGLSVIIAGVFFMNQSKDMHELEAQIAEAQSETSQIERQSQEAKAEASQKARRAAIEATGLDPVIVEDDVEDARDFFTPGFSWTSSGEYNSAREHFINTLGEDNVLTEEYIPEDITIETEDGTLSYIDHMGVKYEVETMNITPLLVEGEQTVRYLAIIQFYMYEESEDLTNTSALTPTFAVVEFTMSGPEGQRQVSEVDAWGGFGTETRE